MNVLKKAGIVVAGSAAALLALSPLAFAGEGHGRHHHDYHPANEVNQANYVGGHSSNSRGLVAIGDVNALNNVNVCPSITTGIGAGDVLGILAPGSARVPVAGGDATCVNDNSIHQQNNAR
jgi:hypothetical protein